MPELAEEETETTRESTETKREAPQADDGEGENQGDAKRTKIAPSEDSKSKEPDQAAPDYKESDPVMPWLTAIGGATSIMIVISPWGRV
jgi:hypothetical protein